MQQQKGADAMLIVSKSGTVSLTRGDTARLKVFPTVGEGDEKQPYTVQEDDVLTFTVKKKYGDDVPLIEKKLTGSTTFHIEPKDTKGLEFGKYKYDVQLTLPDGDNYTFIDKKEFIITEEVG
jgi:hypothetical protein